MKIKTFSKSDDLKHKYVVVLDLGNDKTKTIRFGAYGMEDFTTYEDNERKDRKDRYIKRHQKNENWNDPLTKGFWSRWILWNKKSIRESLIYTKNRFYL
jgi:hypothetical protein